MNPHMKKCLFHSPHLKWNEIWLWTTWHFKAIIKIPCTNDHKAVLHFWQVQASALHQLILYFTSSCNYYNFSKNPLWKSNLPCPYWPLLLQKCWIFMLTGLYLIWFVLLHLFKLIIYTDQHFLSTAPELM